MFEKLTDKNKNSESLVKTVTYNIINSTSGSKKLFEKNHTKILISVRFYKTYYCQNITKYLSETRLNTLAATKIFNI